MRLTNLSQGSPPFLNAQTGDANTSKAGPNARETFPTEQFNTKRLDRIFISASFKFDFPCHLA